MKRNADGADAQAASTAVRLLTMTSLFPSERRPRHGIFVATRLRRICDTGRVSAHVVAPVPKFPGMYRESANVAARETVSGFDTVHPRYWNVPRIGMRMQPALFARAVLTSLAKLGLDGRSFDAVDAHYFYPDGVAGARVAQALGLPLVVSARGSDINLIGDIPFARRAMVGVAHRAQAIVAVSEALRARMIGIGMPPDRIHVLRNGVDTRMFAPAPRAEARKRLGIALDGPLVLGVGNLVAEKGFELLIATLASLPDVRALIVGDGPLRGALQRQAEASVPGRVDFRSAMPQAELRWAYAAADVLALPSLREGWPNVLLEALACGTPVVAAAVGGVREIVSAEAPGRVVEGRDPGAWARAIRSLLSSPPQADQARHYASRFGWDDVVARQCELYESVVRGWSPGARRVEAARVLSHA